MFKGFENETIDFLWGLRLNNNKEWFEAHKESYLRTLYYPMKELAAAIYEPFQKVPGLTCRVSRIYRDARIPHSTPYKESLWINLRRESDSWSQHPCLFFELTPDDYSCGFILWAPKADAMKEFRKRLTEQPEVFLKIANDLKKSTGLTIEGRQYARKQISQDQRLLPYYNLKQIQAYHSMPLDEKIYSPDLAQWVRETLWNCLSLNEFCQQFSY